MPAELGQLHIIHTNDLHSRFEQMPRIASAIRQLKQARAEDQVLTLDIGDHMDRMMVETEGSMGAANVAVLNASGYDAIVLGNNEGLTFPMKTISEAYREHARFAVLGTNLKQLDTGMHPDWMVPSLVINHGGLRVGLVGVTAYYESFYTLLGWTILEPIQAIREEVSKLRLHAGADIIIVMSHLGLTQDRLMAREVTGIDLILGGHTHHLLEQPEREGNTWIAATGSLGKYVGEVSITYDFEAAAVSKVQGRCHLVEQYPIDEHVAGLIDRYREQSIRKLEQPVVELEQSLTIDWYEESELGNLLAAGIRSWTGGEIGLVNAGQLLYALEAGSVTAGQLLSMCPSPINPCLTMLSGSHLMQALEESLLAEYYERPIRGFGFRGQVLGVLCLDGVRVVYDPAGEPYAKIDRVELNGEALQPDKIYQVGMIDMFTFGSGYTTLSQGKNTKFFLPEFIRDVLGEQLKRPEQLKRCKELRWIAQN